MTVDQFPMTITTPAGTWSKVRLVVRHDGAVFVIDQAGNVTHEATGGTAETHPNAYGGWLVHTDEGDWEAGKEPSGCGCQAGPSQRTAQRLLEAAA